MARVIVAACMSLLVACAGTTPNYTEEEAARARTTIETVQIQDVRTGPGEVAENGRRLVVHYSGFLYDPQAQGMRGRPFDSSRTAGRPYEFVLGAGQVIPGWDRGLPGMKEGGVRQLVVPGRLAYGAAGSPPSIPPDATLVFDVELLDVR